jgi:hypothetical protein
LHQGGRYIGAPHQVVRSYEGLSNMKSFAVGNGYASGRTL